jgi:hypothetical protein
MIIGLGGSLFVLPCVLFILGMEIWRDLCGDGVTRAHKGDSRGS